MGRLNTAPNAEATHNKDLTRARARTQGKWRLVGTAFKGMYSVYIPYFDTSDLTVDLNHQTGPNF